MNLKVHAACAVCLKILFINDVTIFVFCLLVWKIRFSIFNQFHFINIRYILLSLLDSSLLAYCQDQYMSVHLNSGENMPAQAPQWTEFLSCQVRLPNRWFLQHCQIQRFCKTKISFKKFLKMKYGLFAVADWIFIFYQLIKIFSSLSFDVFGSPELKPQVIFSDWNLSFVVVLVNFSHFHLLLQTYKGNF